MKGLLGMVIVVLFACIGAMGYIAYRAEVDRAAGAAIISAQAEATREAIDQAQRLKQEADQHEIDMQARSALASSVADIAPLAVPLAILGMLASLGLFVVVIARDVREHSHQIHADDTGLFPVVWDGQVYLNPNAQLGPATVARPSASERLIAAAQRRALPAPAFNSVEQTPALAAALSGAQATQMVVALAQAGADTTPAKLRPAKAIAGDALDRLLAADNERLLPASRTIYEVNPDGTTKVIEQGEDHDMPTGFGEPVRVIG